MDGWVWSNGGMILTGETLSTERKTLYRVGGIWMDEYGAMLEWYWQGKTEVLWEKNVLQYWWYMDEWLWWNGGMILTGENRSAGRKLLYSVGGRWMDEYGALVEWYWQGKPEMLGEIKLYSLGGRWMDECGAIVEWYWQGKPEVLWEKNYTAWVVDGWMSIEQWWNDIDRENWSTVRRTFYSVGGRWMNEYGTMVEWYWQEKFKVLGEKHYTLWVVFGWMSVEQWWNDSDRRKLKYF